MHAVKMLEAKSTRACLVGNIKNAVGRGFFWVRCLQ